MFSISKSTLLDGTKLYHILKYAINYSGFNSIYKATYKKNKIIYVNDNTFNKQSPEDCFIKDLITAIAYSDFALSKYYNGFSTKLIVGLKNFSQKEIAVITYSILNIVTKTYGMDYIVGLNTRQKKHLTNNRIKEDEDNLFFSDFQVDFALDILGELILSTAYNHQSMRSTEENVHSF